MWIRCYNYIILINLFLCNLKVKIKSITINSFFKRKVNDIKKDEEVIF